MKTILLTGDRGYVGSVLAPFLCQRGYKVVGLDTGWFAACCLAPCTADYEQHTGDVRDVSPHLLRGVDAVIHLAALSNDPLGALDFQATESINYRGAVNLALAAKRCGVKQFLFASTQSVYGVSATPDELTEGASLHPETAYAWNKLFAERSLLLLSERSFAVTALRPATVFGLSPRLRCDIVFNNFLACAYTTGKIEVHSDGTPWRPVVHILDLCSAFIAALEAGSAVQGQAYNVTGGNYTVKQLAELAQSLVPGCELVFTGQAHDRRSYRVSGERFHLYTGWLPQWDLERGGRQLLDFFRRAGFSEEQFRGHLCNRLVQLEYLRSTGQLTEDLRCVSTP